MADVLQGVMLVLFLIVVMSAIAIDYLSNSSSRSSHRK